MSRPPQGRPADRRARRSRPAPDELAPVGPSRPVRPIGSARRPPSGRGAPGAPGPAWSPCSGWRSSASRILLGRVAPAADGRGGRRSARPASASGCARRPCPRPAVPSSTATATSWPSPSRRPRSGPILVSSSTRPPPPTPSPRCSALRRGPDRRAGPPAAPHLAVRPAEFVVRGPPGRRQPWPSRSGRSTCPASATTPSRGGSSPATTWRRSIIGGTDPDGKGTSGLELAYDKVLTGTTGELVRERGQDGRTIPAGPAPADPGHAGRRPRPHPRPQPAVRDRAPARLAGASPCRPRAGWWSSWTPPPATCWPWPTPDATPTPARSSYRRPTWPRSTPTSRARSPRS